MDTTDLHFSAARPLDGLQGILEKAREQLADFANDPGALNQMLPIFTGVDREAVDRALVALQHGGVGLFSRIEVLDDRALHGARGAYASSTDTIYLSTSLVAGASTEAGLAVAVRTAIEEMGHRLDWQFHPDRDSAGDEGELFSAKVLGLQLTGGEIDRIAHERDWGTVTIQGQEIAVEQDNTLATATNLGVLSGTRIVQNFIGTTDLDDYYKLTLNGDSRLELNLSNLTADVDIQLFNSVGQLIGASPYTFFSDNPRLLSRILNAGDYYVHLVAESRYGAGNDDTNYQLALKATAIPDGAGNSLATAKDIGFLTSPRAFDDYVGGADINDHYKFTLDQASNVTLNLSNLTADADIEILDVNGNRLSPPSYIYRSNSPRTLSQNLAAGIYYARVVPQLDHYYEPNDRDTNYHLTFNRTVIPDGAGSTIATAKNLGVLTGTTPLSAQNFIGGADPEDYYKFAVNETSKIDLAITELSQGLAISIIDSSNRIVDDLTIYSGYGNSGRLKGLVAAGTYYVRVFHDSRYASIFGDTNYKISLQASPDAAGNTIATARNLGILNGTQRFQDVVAGIDPNDYYKFTLSNNSNFSLGLNDPLSNGRVELIDANGQIIISGQSSQNLSTVFSKALTAGTYYVRIFPRNAYFSTSDPYVDYNNAEYNLTLTANAIADAPGNTLATAKDLGLLSGGTLPLQDSIGGSDLNDYYRFTLNAPSNYQFTLNGFSTNTDLEILNSSGQVLTASRNTGVLADALSGGLDRGTYYLRIYSNTVNGISSYNLNSIISLLPTDTAGNTSATAKSLGVLNGAKTIQEFVGGTDPNDYYQFSLLQASSFTLSLNGLNGDANVRLFNSTGQILASSTAANLGAELIHSALAAGNYYVNVFNNNSSTKYNLNLSATPLLADGAGNTLLAAKDLGLVNNTTRTFQDSVSGLDLNDYYKFTLDRATQCRLSLAGLGANADIQILSSMGQVLKASATAGNAAEFLNQAFSTGTYYIRVYPGANSHTNYNLSLTTTALLADTAGNTQATAKDLGLLTSSRTFQDSVSNLDANDHYKFTLDRTSNCYLALTGMSGNADLQILDSTGAVIYTGTGNSSEFLSGVLNTGTYYVRIYPLLDNGTNYTLSLSASPNAPFSTQYGYGLVNAAAAVAKAIGQTTPFSAVANLGGNNWGADLVNAPEAWARGYRGQGIIVAVIDSGVDYNHTDLDANMWTNTREIAGNGIDDDRNGYIDDVRGWDFIQNDNNPMDVNGHGTHVAGTIAAENNGVGNTGVAYSSKIMAVRVLGDNGSGENLGVAKGIRYAVDNGARVINLSLGGDYSVDIENAITYASQRGAVVVIAAGNSGLGFTYGSSPGNPAKQAISHGIAVGAIDNVRKMGSFSYWAGSNNAMQYVVAPGVDVYSTQIGGGYELLSGTSMAAPHVAGVVALMLSANPNLNPAQVRSILTSSSSALV